MQIAFPFADRWGAKFAPVCMYLLASLTHHYDWICRKLPVSHPVRQTRLFQGDLLPRLKPLLATGDQVTLTPTGIPPWVICFMMMNEMKEMMLGLRGDVRSLPNLLKASIRESLHERDEQNGTASATVVRQLITQLLSDHTGEIATMLDTRLRGLQTVPAAGPTQNTSLPPRATVRYGTWMWAHDSGHAKYRENRYRYLPKDFLLCYDLKDKRRNVRTAVNPLITRKKVTVLHAWNFWFFGLQWGDKLIRPLFKLTADPKFHFFDDNARKRYSDIKGLVFGMLRLLQVNGTPLYSPTVSTPQQIQGVFPKAFDLMEEYIQVNHPSNRRTKTYKETCTCTTMKKHYYESRRNVSTTS